MPTVPRPPPTAERREEINRFHGASQALYGVILEPAEVEPLELEHKDSEYYENVNLWRFKAGEKKDGKSVGGRFTKRPTWALGRP